MSACVPHAQSTGRSPHPKDTVSGGFHRNRQQGVYIRSDSAEDVFDDDVQRPATDGLVSSSVQGTARDHDARCLSVGRQCWLRRTVGRQQDAPITDYTKTTSVRTVTFWEVKGRISSLFFTHRVVSCYISRFQFRGVIHYVILCM